MTELLDRKQLARRVHRLTATIWTLIAVTLASLVAYIPDAIAGRAALPPPINELIYLAAATTIVLVWLARREARGDLRQRDATALVAAESVVVHAALQAIHAALNDAEQDRSHRDGRLYQQIRFQHQALLGQLTERDLERDTDVLPIAVGAGKVYGTAAVPTLRVADVLPAPATVAAMRRLARKVTMTQDED